MGKISIRFYNGREVRAVWDEENAKWWFSVLDIVGDSKPFSRSGCPVPFVGCRDSSSSSFIAFFEAIGLEFFKSVNVRQGFGHKNDFIHDPQPSFFA